MPKKGRQTSRMTPGFTGPFKGEPQQGTLFDKRALDSQGENNTGMTRVGPRGYTLQRSRQFQGALPPVQTSMRPARVDEHIEAIQGGRELGGNSMVPAVTGGQHQYGPVDLGSKHNGPLSQEEMDQIEAKDPRAFSKKEQERRMMSRGRSKMIDTLARSTVSPEHLEGLTSFNIHPKDKRFAGAYYRTNSYDIAGSGRGHINLHVTDQTQTPEYPRDSMRNPKQSGSTEHDPEITLIHEIGHHVSNMRGTPHSTYQTPAQKSGEEGFADNYAMTHWRADPRHQSWHGSFDPREHTYRGRENQLAFAPEYTQKLGKENLPSGPKNYVSAGQEAEDRPMLGHGTGAFDDAIPEKIQRGFSTSWVIPGNRMPNSGTEAEKSWYGRKRQMSNADVFHHAEQPSISSRWQVRRNSLGRQF